MLQIFQHIVLYSGKVRRGELHVTRQPEIDVLMEAGETVSVEINYSSACSAG